jgi:hypothetical protein
MAMVNLPQVVTSMFFLYDDMLRVAVGGAWRNCAFQSPPLPPQHIIIEEGYVKPWFDLTLGPTLSPRPRFRVRKTLNPRNAL